jgi:hypothetical protein
MEEKKLDTAQQQENGTEPEGNEKIFTQEDVDSIVEKRLARERKKYQSILDGKDPREMEIEERERNVAVKELQADVKEKFREKRLPLEAMELLNYTDKESCDKSIEVLETVINVVKNEGIASILKGGAPIKKAPAENEDLALMNAFGLRPHGE